MAYVHQPPQKNKRHYKKPIFIVFGIASLAIAIFAVWSLFKARDVAAPKTVPAQSQAIETDIKEISGKYLFSGTVVPARAVENQARRSDGTIDYNQPFSKLSTFNPDQYHEWVVDMECPVTDANIPYRQQVENTIFNCRPEFLEPMSKYFTIMNLANNHVYDRGKDKFSQMQTYIQDANIQYVGNQDPAVTKDVCEVMAVTVDIKKDDDSLERGELPMAFCAWHYFEREPQDGEFDVIREYASVMPVIGLMQVGQEYQATADDRQERVGRSIIDSGAEFVIGNSPHWVQNSDVYKDKLIFYSTGNFIFDQLDAETNRGASVEAAMTIQYDDNVGKWLAFGNECKQHYDSCLQKAKEQNLSKVNPAFIFDLVASTTGYQELTQKAPEGVQAAVEQRANWQQTLEQLQNR